MEKKLKIDQNLYYDFICRFYGSRKAERSEILYIKHIDEGLAILDAIGASQDAKDAFCVHPMFQSDVFLAELAGRQRKAVLTMDPYIVLLAMEYRNVANAYLCRPETDHYELVDLPDIRIPDIKHMLIADKVQNYKDFLIYHVETHKRSKELDYYFNMWFKHLNVSFDNLEKHI